MSLESTDLSTLGARLGLDGATVTLSGPSDAIALFAGDLVDLTGDEDAPILIMSTGLAANAILPNSAGDQGTDLGLEGGVNDDIILTIEFTKDESDNFFSFDMTFLSEEFDEFVGRDFNDFFVATLNGAPLAATSVDTAGFDISLSTEGTQFDAREQTLRFTTRAPTEQTDSVLQLRIADEGDGRLDSAAFLTNFQLRANTIFLDFEGGDIVFDTGLEDDLTFDMPAADLTEDEIDDILTDVREIFEGFAVDFVTERPEFDDFATIHIGGAFDDLPAFLQSDATVISFSEAIDPGNVSNTDQALVLSRDIVEITDAEAKIGLLTQTISREASHLLGLRNVEDRETVVFPTPGESRTELTATSPIASLNEDGSIAVTDVLQDVPNELANNVGILGEAPVPTISLAEQIARVITIESAGDATVFGLRVAVVDDDDNIIALADLGDLAPGGVVSFAASALETDRVVLIGKSDATQPFDLALSPPAADSFSIAGLTQRALFDAVGAEISDLNSDVLTFVSDAGAASPIAPVLVRASVTGPLRADGDDADNALQSPDDGGSLIGLDGDDALSGAAGADGLFGGDGNDTAAGGAGADDIRGGDGDDSLSGGGDDDLISGGLGADMIDGGSGDDMIFAGIGDVVDGGLGVDELITEIAFADVTLSAGDPGFVFTTSEGVLEVTGVERFQFSDTTLSAAELAALLAPEDTDGEDVQADEDDGRLEGGANDDTLTGSAAEDEIIGNGGADLINAGDADDVVLGGEGNDTIRGQAGGDDLNGGVGDDSIMGGGGGDKLTGRGGDDTMKGGGGDDTLIGGFGEDVLSAGGGDDNLNGGAGGDLVRGGGGGDNLRGGDGDDTLNGGGGDDVLNGGRGADVLRGGGGEDVFQFKTGDGADRIVGFQQGADRIEILRGAEAFSDLDIDQVGAGVRISFANVVITVERQDADSFTAADFIF